MKAIYIIITGDVQGVFYRHHAKKEAKKLDICGWCQNEMNGTVKIFAQAEKENLNKFIDWTKIGSPMSTVEKVEIIETENDNKIKGFEIR